jgi:hypothetical protein
MYRWNSRHIIPWPYPTNRVVHSLFKQGFNNILSWIPGHGNDAADAGARDVTLQGNWYLVFQIWISGSPPVSLVWSDGKGLENTQGNKLREVNHWCSPVVPSVLRSVCHTSTFCLGTHLPHMPPVSDTLFSRLPQLYHHTWMVSLAMHCYWNAVWLLWYFSPSFSPLISQ